MPFSCDPTKHPRDTALLVRAETPILGAGPDRQQGDLVVNPVEMGERASSSGNRSSSHRQVGQLGPEPDHLPQLPNLRWGDPRFRQTIQAQQVSQVAGVTLIVLHPPHAPIVALRMGQMHPQPHLLEQITAQYHP